MTDWQRSADNAISVLEREIVGRAGAGRRHRYSARKVVYWAVDENSPPALECYNPRTGKRTGRKSDRGRSSRRVVVGQSWLRANMPDGWAAVCAFRLAFQRFPFSHVE